MDIDPHKDRLRETMRELSSLAEEDRLGSKEKVSPGGFLNANEVSLKTWNRLISKVTS